MLQVDERQSGCNFDVTIGDAVEVQLSENPTTGYRWQLYASYTPLLSLENDAFESSSQLPGAAGLRRWRFQALKEGEVQIKLDRRRSWERKAVQTFTIKIAVKRR